MAYLELVLKKVLLVGHLAIETQQTLLLWSQRLDNPGCQLGLFFFSSVISGWPTAKTYTDINLVLLMRVHYGNKRTWSTSQKQIVCSKGSKQKQTLGCGCVLQGGCRLEIRRKVEGGRGTEDAKGERECVGRRRRSLPDKRTGKEV